MFGFGATGQFAIGQVDFGGGMGWFAPLSAPPRAGASVRGQPFAAYSPNQLTIIPFGWFEPLSEPVRRPPTLARQFEARPSQLRPTPTMFISLSATETKDDFLAGGMEWTTVTSGEVGTTANDFSGGEIGVAGQPITTVKVSIRIM
jgi:hypothetical protein